MATKIYRVLRLSDAPTGADVKHLQSSANSRLKARKENNNTTIADGIYGPDTARAVSRALYLLGVEGDRFNQSKVANGGIVDVRSQEVIIKPSTRDKGMLERSKARKEHIEASRPAKPQIKTSAAVGMTFQYVFGGKGAVVNGTGHYTAGHRCANMDDLVREAINDHAFHKGKGWGGLSYEVMIADNGAIFFGNPMDRKGAAVALHNTGMVNISCPGTRGDRMSAGQKASIRWLMDNWHTSAVPAPYRLPKKAALLEWRGHHEWPDQATECPGDMLGDYHGVFPS